MDRFKQMRHWYFDSAWRGEFYTHRSIIGELVTIDEGRITSYSHPATQDPITVAQIKEYYNGKR